ncbi:hypothetical protein C8R45DRAFT_960818 [Mycena sanguinolenta]|nr:hypothetical protein C8R45DRAFT_960818 [Mycena sanguinolenta]
MYGDIKETLALAYRLYAILHSGGEPSGEIKKVLQVLKSLYDDTATLMKYLETNSSTNLSPDAQTIFNGMSAELQSCESLMKKLYTQVGQSNSFFTRIWLAVSEKALASWRAEMAEHRAIFHTHLESLLAVPSTQVSQHHQTVNIRIEGGRGGRGGDGRKHGTGGGGGHGEGPRLYIRADHLAMNNHVLSAEGNQQLEYIGSYVQYIESGVERVEDLTRAGFAHQASQMSNFGSQFQQFMQSMNLRQVSEAVFSVTDPLGRPIPISLAHCGDFDALDRMLKACIFNRPEAGARYVERGDYNLFLPEGTIVRRIDFARTVKPGMELDMSIIKRQQSRHKPDLKECPYCYVKNPRPTKNKWIHCSNHQCGRRYQISAKAAEEIEEIYSPQLLTKRDAIQQEEEDTDLFRLVEIQATYRVSFLYSRPLMSSEFSGPLIWWDRHVEDIAGDIGEAS